MCSNDFPMKLLNVKYYDFMNKILSASWMLVERHFWISFFSFDSFTDQCAPGYCTYNICARFPTGSRQQSFNWERRPKVGRLSQRKVAFLYSSPAQKLKQMKQLEIYVTVLSSLVLKDFSHQEVHFENPAPQLNGVCEYVCSVHDSSHSVFKLLCTCTIGESSDYGGRCST